MLNAFANLLCLKLCRHNWCKPRYNCCVLCRAAVFCVATRRALQLLCFVTWRNVLWHVVQLLCFVSYCCIVCCDAMCVTAAVLCHTAVLCVAMQCVLQLLCSVSRRDVLRCVLQLLCSDAMCYNVWYNCCVLCCDVMHCGGGKTAVLSRRVCMVMCVSTAVLSQRVCITTRCVSTCCCIVTMCVVCITV